MASLNLKGKAAACLICCLFAFPVHTLPLQAKEISAERATEPDVAGSDDSSDGVEGVAFYYAKRYNGRRTNSGARYNPAKMTAAHPDLPHGTKVKVVNIANNKEVVVTVNDRCRKRKLPVIDLSRAAARKLGFLGKGSAKVIIIPLSETAS